MKKIEASFCAGVQACDVVGSISTWGNKIFNIFIFSLWLRGKVEFHRSTHNASRNQRKVGGGSVKEERSISTIGPLVGENGEGKYLNRNRNKTKLYTICMLYFSSYLHHVTRC